MGEDPLNDGRVLNRGDALNPPGTAFAVGNIQSIENGDDTRFFRVTEGDVETKETLRFDVEKKTVQVANRAKGER
jgi:hypothetical protein